jgi:hypothetical protein
VRRIFPGKCAKIPIFFSLNQLRIMIKKIEINTDVLKKVRNGKYVEGSVRIDATTGKLTFVAYNRISRNQRKHDIMIKPLEHGWLKESPERYKYYQSIPKRIGMPCVLGVLDRETSLAKIELSKIGE